MAATPTPQTETIATRPESSEPPSQQERSKPKEKRGPRAGGGGTISGPLVTVSRVIDGDTVEVTHRGQTIDVRLIGIDTPETVHPSEPVGCHGPAASAFVTRHLEGERLQLEFDVERTDQYGRTLAYIWKNGSLFNRVLVERGFAQVTIYPPDDKYAGRLYAAEDRAKKADNGTWGLCPYFGAPATGATAGGSDVEDVGSVGAKCDPNYQGACVPRYPPDLDCDDIPKSGFHSSGSDPHGFDGDADGVSCE